MLHSKNYPHANKKKQETFSNQDENLSKQLTQRSKFRQHLNKTTSWNSQKLRSPQKRYKYSVRVEAKT